MINQNDLNFVVEPLRKGTTIITWRFPGQAGLAEYLYWADIYKTRYRVIPAYGDIPRKIERPVMELVPQMGAGGEYRQGVYFSLPGGYPFRVFHSGLHYITQHGLDGVPKQILELLQHPQAIDQPRFRVQGPSFAFDLSCAEWWNYFASGRNDSDLSKLGIQYVHKPR